MCFEEHLWWIVSSLIESIEPHPWVPLGYSFYFWTKTYVVCTQKYRLNEMVLLITHNKCLNRWTRRYSQFYATIFCLSGTKDNAAPFLIALIVFDGTNLGWLTIRAWIRYNGKRFAAIFYIDWWFLAQKKVFSDVFGRKFNTFLPKYIGDGTKVIKHILNRQLYMMALLINRWILSIRQIFDRNISN